MKIQNKTICIFSSFAYPHAGGVELYVKHLSRHLVERGYQVIVVSLNTDGLKAFDIDNQLIQIRLPCFSLLKGRYPVPRPSVELLKLWQMLNSYQIDFVFLNVRFYVLTVMAAFWGQFKHKPMILVEHGTGHFDLGKPVLNSIAAAYEHFLTSLLRLNKIRYFGVSQACGDWLLHFNIKASGVIYNGIEMNIGKADREDFRKRFHLKSDEVIISFVGRLIIEKGVRELLDAFARINQEYKNTTLFIAGEGPLKQEIPADNEHIFALGRIGHEYVIKLMEETDILVMPSRFPEGMPTVLLEAASQECAIIATPMGGTTEIILDDSMGMIIEDTLSDRIYQALKYYLDNPQRRAEAAKKLRNSVLQRFNWETIVNKLVSEVIEDGNST